MTHWQNLIAALGASVTFVVIAHAATHAPRSASQSEKSSTKRAVEIRSYNLKPGTRSEFHRLASEVAVPMLRRWQVDVVAYGPSPHDDTSYYLIRSYPNLAERQRSEDAFYGSDEWRNGPREQVLARIQSYTTIILELEPAVVETLRRP